VLFKYRNFFAITPLTGPCVLHFHEFFPVIIFAYCNFVLHYLRLDMKTFEGEKFPQRVKERWVNAWIKCSCLWLQYSEKQTLLI